jgi:hypothetical protein
LKTFSCVSVDLLASYKPEWKLIGSPIALYGAGLERD